MKLSDLLKVLSTELTVRGDAEVLVRAIASGDEIKRRASRVFSGRSYCLDAGEDLAVMRDDVTYALPVTLVYLIGSVPDHEV